MKPFDWSKEKNEKLRAEREIGFEDIVEAVNSGRVLEIIDHPNQKKYPNQKELIVCINDYVYLVPYMEDEEKIFLKTIIPSRRATKRYITKS